MYSTKKDIQHEKENIIDPNLEKIDPTPSIFNLFRQFNLRFFWDKLDMVQVSWSGRQMTSCAGLCSFQPRTGYCSIRLSAPLLSLRPRKDLVETLLHEMIHAYLFITKNYKDRSDHGPEFHKHMNRINMEAGTNITVFHTFNDEVAHYKSHVWRCNGPCQKVGPFFGFVRRATGRAPGPNDKWWDTHKLRCSGVFEKIEEPPGYKAKGKKKETASSKGSSSDLRNFFVPTQKSSDGSNIHSFIDLTGGGSSKGSGGMLKNKGSATYVLGGTATTSKGTKTSSTSGSPNLPKGIKSKIPGSSNLPSGFKGKTPSASGSPHLPSSSKHKSGSSINDQVRNVWAQKYPSTEASSGSLSSGAKKSAAKCENCKEIHEKNSFCPQSSVRNVWAQKYPSTETSSGSLSSGTKKSADKCDNCTEIHEKNSFCPQSSVRNVWAQKYPAAKRKTDTPPTSGGKKRASECEYCKDVIDEDLSSSHGQTCRTKRFPCPVCMQLVQNGSLEVHLSICLSDSITEDIFCTEEMDIFEDSNVDTQNVACPICAAFFPENKINSHIDECLNLKAIRDGDLDIRV